MNTEQAPASVPPTKIAELSYAQRSNLCVNPTAKNFFLLMEGKKSNLCLAADLSTAKELFSMVDLVGPHIAMLKTHIDIIDDFDETVIPKLEALAIKHKFMIFEDRKFADIGNTVQKQYSGGVFKISQWADIVNSHLVSGESSVAALREVGLPLNRGLLLLAQMSTVDTNTNEQTTAACAEVAQKYPDFVIGFICQERFIQNPSSPQYLYCTPGVNFSSGGDQKGQQYNTPEFLITEKKTDVIIVGRGICNAEDPLAVAKEYQEAGWAAYLKRLAN